MILKITTAVSFTCLSLLTAYVSTFPAVQDIALWFQSISTITFMVGMALTFDAVINLNRY